MKSGEENGYVLIVAIIAVNLIAVFSLMAASIWQRESEREMEAELFFRGNEYVRAITKFRRNNLNRYPENLEILYKKKFLRKLYKDPMSDSGEWNIVMKSKMSGNKKLLIVPAAMLEKYIKRAYLIGVSSTSIDEGFRVYRGKNRYDEWAFYLGQKTEKEMPELKFVAE
jgi:hypothetical protein